MTRYVAGVVNYKTYDDLASCLESLTRQTIPPAWIRVVDADGDPVQAEALAKRFPTVRWSLVPNRGFGAGANRFLAEGRADPYLPEAALLLNPDIELEPDYAERLLDELRAHRSVALASGKLLRPCRTRIDSAGISLPRHRRPYDRGSFQLDHGQYDETERVFAVCGAAMMLRLSALGTLEVDGEVFDESFFAYREDTDLCWRANLLGFDVLYVPAARAVHQRRWKPESAASRRAMPSAIRCHSFKNHCFQILKNERASRLMRDLPVVAGFEAVRLAYALLWDRDLLPAYVDIVKQLPQMWSRRRAIFARRAARLGESIPCPAVDVPGFAAEVELA